MTLQAADNAFNVGDYAGEFVSRLITNSGADQEDIHIVGFRSIMTYETLIFVPGTIIRKEIVKWQHLGKM